MRPCPFCAESIQEEAIKCRWCGEALDPARLDALRREMQGAEPLGLPEPPPPRAARPSPPNRDPLIALFAIFLGGVLAFFTAAWAAPHLFRLLGHFRKV